MSAALKRARIRRRAGLAPILLALIVWMTGLSLAHASERRCGWYQHAPGAQTLSDREGHWLLRAEGRHEARGIELIQEYSRRQFPEGNLGRRIACVCLEVDMALPLHEVLRVLSVEAMPKARCSDDRTLAHPIR